MLSGGRGGSARSARQQPDPDRLCGYGSLGSLTDDLPLQRRIVSAGKGKNKLPWERSSLPYSEDAQPARGLQTNEEQVGHPRVFLVAKQEVFKFPNKKPIL